MALKKIGTLWRKESKKGKYFTGVLDLGALGEVQVAVFQNDKDNPDDKAPDATICRFEDE
jgi:hypothetical protein